MVEENLIAVLTGVGRGLGLVMAKGLAELGYQILGCSHSAESCVRTMEALGYPHVVRQVDVSNVLAVESWAEEMLGKFSAPNLLINNAAVINRNAELWRVSPEDFHRTMRVNVEGTYHVIRSFLPAMIEARRGVIVNFSSGWGRSTSPEVAPYCASKYAIEGLTRSLSQELPDGLAAVALNPGVINTDMLQSCFAEGAKAYPSPEKWAKAAVPFLAKLTAKDNGKSLSIPNF